MGDRGRQALSEQRLLCTVAVVARQIGQYCSRRPELAAGSQASGTQQLTRPPPSRDLGSVVMATSVDRQICFRLAAAGPAPSPKGQLRLGDAQAEALSELLQVFACGEESASLAFARLGASPLENAACS